MHSKYLNQAKDLAKTRRGYCAPNPAVGAVIVRDEQVIATGVTQDPGFDHAEVDAIKNAQGVDLQGATLYVSLEPCCHWGKTPPCTDAIIEAGITQVYYGYRDPNPIVDGGGAHALKQAGIQCEYISSPSIDEFYQSYTHWVKTGQPWVTAKLAMSLDGKIADVDGGPIEITSPEAKELTFQHRRSSDAILTTAQTIIADDPQLTIRSKNSPIEQRPIYTLDRQLRAPLTASLFVNTVKNTVFYSPQFSGKLPTRFDENHIRYVAVDEQDGGLNLQQTLTKIGADGIHDLWVEAGSRLYNALLGQNLVHRALVYIAPKLIGEGIPAFVSQSDWTQRAAHLTWYHQGPDAVLDLRFEPQSQPNKVTSDV